MFLRTPFLVLASLCALATASVAGVKDDIVDRPIAARAPATVFKTKTVTVTKTVTTSTKTATSVIQTSSTITTSTSTYTVITLTSSDPSTLTVDQTRYVTGTTTKTLTYSSSADRRVAQAFGQQVTVTRTTTKTKTIGVVATVPATSTQTLYTRSTSTSIKTYYETTTTYASTVTSVSTSYSYFTFTTCAGTNPYSAINLRVSDITATKTDQYNKKYATVAGDLSKRGHPTVISFAAAQPTPAVFELDCAQRLRTNNAAGNPIYWVGAPDGKGDPRVNPFFYSEAFYVDYLAPIYCIVDSGALKCSEVAGVARPVTFETCGKVNPNSTSKIAFSYHKKPNPGCVNFEFKVVNGTS